MTKSKIKFVCSACKEAATSGDREGHRLPDGAIDHQSLRYFDKMAPLHGPFSCVGSPVMREDSKRSDLEDACSFCFVFKWSKNKSIDKAYEITPASLTGGMHNIVKDANAYPSLWFSEGSMKFFGTRLRPFNLCGLFITSEESPGNIRNYSVRRYRGFGEVDTVGDFHSYDDIGDAYWALALEFLITKALWSSEAFEPFTGMDYVEKISGIYTDGWELGTIVRNLLGDLRHGHREVISQHGIESRESVQYLVEINVFEDVLSDVLIEMDHFKRLANDEDEVA